MAATTSPYNAQKKTWHIFPPDGFTAIADSTELVTEKVLQNFLWKIYYGICYKNATELNLQRNRYCRNYHSKTATKL